MEFCTNTDVGKLRNINEDSFLVKSYNDDNLIAIIADGMGGHNAGEKASRLAAESFVSIVDSDYPDIFGYSDRKISQTLKKIVKQVNNIVYSASIEDVSLNGMGTTLVACLVVKNKFYVVNVGDSRLYRIDSNEIRQITKDHSYVSELLEMGIITPEQAMIHPKKNVITRAIGSEPIIEADVYIDTFEEDCCLLLCTDGLSNMVDDNEIYKCIRESESLEKSSSLLVDMANKSGGKDNISLVLINY